MKSEFPSRVHHKHNLYSMTYMHCASALPAHVLRWAGMRFQAQGGQQRAFGESWPPNQGQVAKVDRDLRRTIHDDDTQTVYG
jgi:hypothetical protein